MFSSYSARKSQKEKNQTSLLKGLKSDRTTLYCFSGVHSEVDAPPYCQVERAEGRRQGSLPTAGGELIFKAILSLQEVFIQSWHIFLTPRVGFRLFLTVTSFICRTPRTVRVRVCKSHLCLFVPVSVVSSHRPAERVPALLWACLSALCHTSPEDTSSGYGEKANTHARAK